MVPGHRGGAADNVSSVSKNGRAHDAVSPDFPVPSHTSLKQSIRCGRLGKEAAHPWAPQRADAHFHTGFCSDQSRRRALAPSSVSPSGRVLDAGSSHIRPAYGGPPHPARPIGSIPERPRSNFKGAPGRAGESSPVPLCQAAMRRRACCRSAGAKVTASAVTPRCFLEVDQKNVKTKGEEGSGLPPPVAK